jgi:uroporphyrinogen-III decarboxylase
MKTTGLERTLAFINGDKTDRPPFHPIIMRWAASQARVKYRDFCTIPSVKCEAMIRAAMTFDIDWVTVMSDPWAEASAFGIEVEYPENGLPLDTGGHLHDARSVALLKPYHPEKNKRCAARIEEIRLYRHSVGHNLFIVGWIEGPVAEYVDLRRASEAAMDFYLDPDNVEKAMEIITESAKTFITYQINAGAHCIGIGDAFCSQIGPDLYYKFAFEREKQLIEHIHHHGAIAKLHICGNTASILPGMIRTGADIIDIDHLVPSLKEFSSLLSPTQVFSGKSDPVSVIQDGDRDGIFQSVVEDHKNSNGRCIVSAGCEITPDTESGNIIAFADAAKSLQSK